MSRDKSKMGYRDDSPYRNEPYIDIHTPNGMIDMSATGIPILANGRILPPYSGEHQFDSNVVHEVPLRQNGGPMHQMPDGTWMPGASHGEYQDGGVISPGDGWDYKKVGDKYLTKQSNSDKWITAQLPSTINAIKSKIFKEAPLDNSQQSPQQQPQKPDQSIQQKNYKVSKNLKDGYLPLMQGHKGSEICRGSGCSSAVSIKLSNLLEGVSDEDLWAEDAWFNKDAVLKGDGALIYETKERDLDKMPTLPKDVWGKLQVGDYVELNRKDTNSSRQFAQKTKGGLRNEGIEHLGFVVGKDEDGVPLIWHGSEKGQAYIQRMDGPINLPDHKNLGDYKVSSIVRAKGMTGKKREDLEKLQNKPYYTPIDENKKLIPTEDATEDQIQAVNAINESIADFKNIGYSQDDINLVGQLLAGGIMENESKAGESLRRLPKQGLAYALKDLTGIMKGEASMGVYQLKDDLNFKNKDGSFNTLGKNLKQVDVDPNNIFDSVGSQTKAGMLMLLDNYKKLRSDKNFNPETNLYNDAIPASYILAKSWQAGSGWQNKEKYKDFLENLDVDYSNNALKKAAENVRLTGGRDSIVEDNAFVEEVKVQKARDFFEQNPDYFTMEPEYAQSSSTTVAPLQTLPLEIDNIDRNRLAEEERKEQEFQSSKKRPGAYQFEDGGESIEIELDDEAIKHYRSLGYTVDEI